jgi:phosphatidylethanolamine-binding protein (PEBP) family uncharacterized protein
LIHHYVFTVYALAIERVPVEGTSPAPRCARRSIRTSWPRPRTRAPTRSTSA